MDDSLSCLVRYNGVPTDAQARQIRHILTSEQQKMHSNSVPPLYDLRRVQLLRLLAGTLSCIRRFPPEILSIVFIFCCDGDISSKDEVYTIVHPNRAPMLLTRICSRWRQIALDTPRLWDNVHLHTTLFAKGDVEEFIPDILRRSHSLPLSITIDTPLAIINGATWLALDGVNDYNGRWLDLLWTDRTIRLRLRSITLDLYEDEHESHIFPLPETEFPALANLALTLEGNSEPDLVQILDAFKHAPLLHSLELEVQFCSDVMIKSTFPWHQLTTLKMSLALTSKAAHTILVQCTSLERTKFDNIHPWDSDISPPPPAPALLSQLRDFDFEWRDGSQTGMVLGGLSLPQLRSLAITSLSRSDWEDLQEPLTPVLLDLHARSHFALEHLALSGQLLNPAELLSVLRIAPTLRTLNVRQCECITDELFEMLTANDSLTTLPHLARLEIHPITATLDGNVVVTMAESLFKKANAPASNGDPTLAMFPSLIQLCLYRGDEVYRHRNWERFAEDLEHRIAVLCETGFLVDRYRRR
ncbi:hypothetical protein R3P38DRAFT_3120659 [Favolaschia claudopus]|uniref:F-box domain-containing protein n=1 Tax=Favolaschia claudopus TaxID=2862362 RepID=A0AAV9ZCZ8_9AGAR